MSTPPDSRAHAAAVAAGQLADAAVPFQLALAAADPEAGASLLAACLAQELAAGHRGMLRMAVAANALLDGDCSKAAAGVARTCGSSGRVMEEVRLALVALSRLTPSAALGERARPIKAAADVVAERFAAEAGVADLIGRSDIPFLRGIFAHELAAAHGLTMRLYGAADRAFDFAAAKEAAAKEATAAEGPVAAERLLLAAARMSGRVRRGLLAHSALALPPSGNGARFRPAPAPAAPAPAAPKLYAAPDQARGTLANGNPSGDFLAAKRCGACTRAGTPCRQPAMASPGGGRGRCRFHGGKSTGPKTAHGLQRSRTARRIHGAYSAEIVDLQKYAAQQARRIRDLRLKLMADSCQLTALPAGHGVHPHESRRSRGRLVFQAPPAASTTAA